MTKIRKTSGLQPTTNKAISNCMKIHEGDAGAIGAEAEDRLGKDHSNVDPSRKENNRFLRLDDKGEVVFDKNKPMFSLDDRIHNRIAEAGATIRQDRYVKPELDGQYMRQTQVQGSVICEGLILQASHSTAMEMLREDGLLDENGRIRKDINLKPEHKTYRYFRDSYKWACDRYGKENVVGCALHMDEYTPHLHVFVVPLKKKTRHYTNPKTHTVKKWTQWTLDAKHIFSPEECSRIWTDYAEAMKGYGLERVEGSKEKGKQYDKVASMSKMLEYQNSEYEIKADTIRAQQTFSEQLDETLNKKAGENKNILDKQESIIQENEKTINQQTDRLDKLKAQEKESENNASLYFDSAKVSTGYMLLQITNRYVKAYLAKNTDEMKQELKEKYLSLFREKDRNFAERQFNDQLEFRLQRIREDQERQEKKKETKIYTKKSTNNTPSPKR